MPAATITEYIDSLSDPLNSVARTLRDHLDAALPTATGQIWHGHPVWMVDSTPIAGFKTYQDYITFMLWRGQAIDSAGALTATGAGEMATLKVARAAEVHGPALRTWLTQANNLAVNA